MHSGSGSSGFSSGSGDNNDSDDENITTDHDFTKLTIHHPMKIHRHQR
jgi:hypothetical protein